MRRITDLALKVANDSNRDANGECVERRGPRWWAKKTVDGEVVHDRSDDGGSARSCLDARPLVAGGKTLNQWLYIAAAPVRSGRTALAAPQFLPLTRVAPLRCNLLCSISSVRIGVRRSLVSFTMKVYSY